MQVQRKRKQVQRKQVQRKQVQCKVGIGRHRERCSIVPKRPGQSKRGRGRQSKEKKKNKIEIFNLQAREQWSNRPNLPFLVVG